MKSLILEEETFAKIKKILISEREDRTKLDLEFLIKNLQIDFVKNLYEKFGELIVFTFLKSIHWKEYKKDDIIYKMGEHSDHSYILLKGQIEYCIPISKGKSLLRKIIKNKQLNKIDYKIIETLNEGIIFGDKEITERKNREYTAKCLTDCILGEISKQDYISIFENYKKLEFNEEMKFLNYIQVFKDTNGNIVKRILLELNKKIYKKDEIIVTQGSLLDKIFIIRKGEFEINYKHKINFKSDYNINYFLQLDQFSRQRFTTNRIYELKDSVDKIDTYKVFINESDVNSWTR